MNFEKMNKSQLLDKCKELGITKCKSKTKSQLIELINLQTGIVEQNKIDETQIHTKEEGESINEFENENKLKFIDLFCGIGGFHQALNKLGAQCVLACDIDKDCREVYKDNYGIVPVNDIKKINEKTMPDFDILCGGFPCQAFSNGGKKQCFWKT